MSELFTQSLRGCTPVANCSTPTPMTIETVLSQATAWGFVCQKDVHGNRQILPQKPAEKWVLQLVGDRWLLIVGNVPQISLQPFEANDFLKRHRLIFKEKKRL